MNYVTLHIIVLLTIMQQDTFMKLPKLETCRICVSILIILIRFLVFGIKNQRRRFHSLLIFHRINHTDYMMSGLKIALINIKLQDKLVITVAYLFDEKTK